MFLSFENLLAYRWSKVLSLGACLQTNIVVDPCVYVGILFLLNSASPRYYHTHSIHTYIWEMHWSYIKSNHNEENKNLGKTSKPWLLDWYLVNCRNVWDTYSNLRVLSQLNFSTIESQFFCSMLNLSYSVTCGGVQWHRKWIGQKGSILEIVWYDGWVIYPMLQIMGLHKAPNRYLLSHMKPFLWSFTTTASNVPLTMCYLTHGKSLTLPPLTRNTKCLWWMSDLSNAKDNGGCTRPPIDLFLVLWNVSYEHLMFL